MKNPATFPHFPFPGSRFATIAAMAPALFSEAKAQFVGSEDFSQPLSLQKWFPYTRGSGSLSLSNQKFNFISTSSFGEHEAGLTWSATTVPNTQDWEFQIDVENLLSVSSSTRYGSIGLYIANGADANDLVYLEFYSAFFNLLGQSVHGFTSGLKDNGTGLHEGDTFELPFNAGALRAKFNSSEHTLTLYFHTGPTTGGYFWQLLAKYGLDGDDGTSANANWAMASGVGFEIGLYGTVIGSRSSAGQLTADNFTTTRLPIGLHEIDFELEASLNQTGNAVALSWFSFDGLEYVVQESHDLISWTDLTSVPGTGAYSGLELPVTAPSAPAFYRIYSRLP